MVIGRFIPREKKVITGKHLKAKKIKDLKEQLKEVCIRDNLKDIGSFTIMFDEENGRNIEFVKDMLIECTGGMREFYDRDSEYFNPEYGNINWPYTGFVQGNMAGWNPISEVRIIEWLENYGYRINDFIESFKNPIPT